MSVLVPEWDDDDEVVQHLNYDESNEPADADAEDTSDVPRVSESNRSRNEKA